jgi:hypothetical protein
MKKFLLVLALALGLGAVSHQASATTITINPNPLAIFGETAAPNENISNAYQFSFTGTANGFFGALSFAVQNLATAICTDATCSGGTIATGVTGSGPFGLLSLSIGSFTGLAGGTYYLVIAGLASHFGGAYLGGVALDVTATTPIPAALLMFMTALGGLGVFGRFRKGAGTAA